MIKNLANCLLVFSLASCSPSELVTLPIDSTAAISFAERVKQRFASYAETSGYQYPKSGDPNVRDGDQGELFLVYRAKASGEDVVIYTFDRSDSCIVYSGSLADETHVLRIESIPIPRGRYLLKLGDDTTSFDRP